MKLEYDEPLSNFALNSHLRRYIVGAGWDTLIFPLYISSVGVLVCMVGPAK